MSNDESEHLEKLKTHILLNILPFSKIDESIVDQAAADLSSNNQILTNYYNWLKILQIDLDKGLSVEELKQAKASYYSSVYGDITN